MSTDPEMGWQRIIDLEAGNSHSFEAMKVAHHGSANADHAHIWSNLLIEGPLAILTPYGRGRSPLPQKADVVRIKERAKSVYITKNPSTVSSKPQRDPGVERQMSRICKTRRSISRAPGQVRIRARISDGLISPTIELFEGAAQL